MNDDRATAMAFMEALWTGNLDACDAMMTDDATWHFQLGMPQAKLGRGRVWPAREALRRIVADLFGKFDPEGFTVTPTRTVSENGVVAVEYEARGRTSAGADYENYYVTLLTVRGGKIADVRPHNDTLHMIAMLTPEQLGRPPA